MEWQPIETAPKDGTPFLALCGWSVSTCRIVDREEKRVTRTVGPWPFRREIVEIEEGGAFLEHVQDGGAFINIHVNRFGMPPTHWMPLPQPPQIKETTE